MQVPKKQNQLELEPILNRFSRKMVSSLFYASIISHVIMFEANFINAYDGISKENAKKILWEKVEKRDIGAIAVIPIYYLGLPAVDIAYWAHERGLGRLIFGE